MAIAEYAAGTYRTGFTPDIPRRPKIDLRTPQERERDAWIGERSERRIASALREIRIGGIRVVREIIRYGKASWEDYEKKDMTALFVEGSPIKSVDIQSKSGPTGEQEFLEKMEEDMRRRGIRGISPEEWMAMNGIILLNGRGSRAQIRRDFKLQLFRVLQLRGIAA
jgi:hypothetical protein